MPAAHLSAQNAIIRLQEIITNLEGEATLATVGKRVTDIFQGQNSCNWAIESLNLAEATKRIGIVEEVPNELHITIALIAIYVLQSPDDTFEDDRGHSFFKKIKGGGEVGVLVQDGEPDIENLFMSRGNHKHPSMDEVFVSCDLGPTEEPVLLSQAADDKSTIRNQTMAKWTCTANPPGTWHGVALPKGSIFITFPSEGWKPGGTVGRRGADPEFPIKKGDLTTKTALAINFPDTIARITSSASEAIA